MCIYRSPLGQGRSRSLIVRLSVRMISKIAKEALQEGLSNPIVAVAGMKRISVAALLTKVKNVHVPTVAPLVACALSGKKINTYSCTCILLCSVTFIQDEKKTRKSSLLAPEHSRAYTTIVLIPLSVLVTTVRVWCLQTYTSDWFLLEPQGGWLGVMDHRMMDITSIIPTFARARNGFTRIVSKGS